MKTRLVIFVAVLASLAIAAFVLPVGAWLASLLDWVSANPGVSWLVFGLVYVIAVVALAPGSILTLAAGFVFDLPVAILLVWVAASVGATISFVLGRYFVRSWIDERLAGNARFSAIDAAVADKGALIVLLTRLSPVFPFSLLNYGLGLTRVPLPHYIGASMVGMLPGTALYVYLGSAGQSLTALLSGDVGESSLTGYLFVGGLIATAVLTVVITRIATNALNKQLNSEAV